jgi:hypothetical protein
MPTIRPWRGYIASKAFMGGGAAGGDRSNRCPLVSVSYTFYVAVSCINAGFPVHHCPVLPGIALEPRCTPAADWGGSALDVPAM